MQSIHRHALAAPLAALFLAAAPGAASPQDTREAATQADEPARLGVELAAIATDVELTFDELHELLAWRHGRSPTGQSALRELVQLRLLDHIAEARGVVVSQAELNRGWKEFDDQLKADGDEGGARAYLETHGVTPETFREYLRLGIIHERLTRLALGLDEDAPLTGEQQTMWLENEVRGRGLVEKPLPWTDGVVATCGDMQLTSAEFIEHLRDQLPTEDVTDACYQLLLEKRVRARLPDVSAAAIERGVDEEIDRRRKNAEADPKFRGVKYEQLLGAQGLSIESMQRDPSVRAAALAHLWIDRTHTDEDVRAAYAAERDIFDGRYGEAVQIYALLLKAALFKNDLNPRTFDEAEKQLFELRAGVDTVEEFAELAGQHSEDKVTREKKGLLGSITRGASNVPEPIRRAAFEVLDRAPGSVAGRLIGPLRLNGGCVLVCLGDRRPAPNWETMSRHVRRSLRQRFLDESLHKSSVATWLETKK